MGEFPSLLSFWAGGIAGLAIELALHPLDTLTTRRQTSIGFWKAGGFRHVYKGIGSVSLVSFPHSAVFFVIYESIKQGFAGFIPNMVFCHGIAATVGEIVGNCVRVPAEVVKQRAQAIRGQTCYSSLLFTLRGEGFRGLYRGYQLSVAQDIPFSVIQFVIWERLKIKFEISQGRPANAIESGVAGAVGGSIAAFVTTPLDVAKTRVVLAQKESSLVSSTVLGVINEVRRTDGIQALFRGSLLRIMSYSVGSLAYFYLYERTCDALKVAFKC